MKNAMEKQGLKQWLIISAVSCVFITTGVALAVTQPPLAHPVSTSQETVQIVHLLNRITNGPSPGDVERVKAMGIDRYIQSQLNPQSIPESPTLTQALSAIPTLQMGPAQLFAQFEQPIREARKNKDDANMRDLRLQIKGLQDDAVKARVMRAVYSNRQLEAVMTDFWFNHFNIYSQKGIDHLYVASYEAQAIRPYALGHFRDLLETTSHHPGMLFYLDNWQNTAPNSPGAKGKFNGLNENYARELMELHTLGVDGGYSQNDVIALAKILTGWGICGPKQPSNNAFGFCFTERRHEPGSKLFLGHTIAEGGMSEGEQALDILAKSPATAHHISYELAQYFVADDPPAPLVSALSKTYLATNGDIRAVLNTLFHSESFWDAKNMQNKFKTPYQYVISAVRASGYTVRNVTPIDSRFKQLGMPLYGCQTPDGYKNTKEAWLNPDAMIQRLSFASALTTGRIPIDHFDLSPTQPVDPMQLEKTLGAEISPDIQAEIAKSPAKIRSAMILGSPDFMYR